MTRDEGRAILKMPEDQALSIILALADKAERYDQMQGEPSPTTPSSMIPVYLKPSRGKRKKRPGRKKDHPGVARSRPEKVDEYQEHTLACCPYCQTPVQKPIKVYRRYIEDLPPIEAPLFGYGVLPTRSLAITSLPRVGDLRS